MNSILTIRNLRVSFPSIRRTVRAVRDVSLTLNEGEIVALVGESGSGKTMTAMAALGLLPDSADVSGECNWLGETMTMAELGRNSKVAGDHAAIIFQNPLTALNPFFTIGQQLKDVAIASGKVPADQLEKAMIDSLGRVQLPEPREVLRKYPHQLSGGQIQRVVIAMALICKPRVLIADEPTTALDVIVQAEILALVRNLAREHGLSVLLITHDLGVVSTICDRVEVMYAGQIVESGSVNTVLTDPSHPYTRKLLATVPDIESSADTLEFIPGQVPDLSKPLSGCAFKDRCEQRFADCDQSPPVRTRASGQMIRCHLVDAEEERLVS